MTRTIAGLFLRRDRATQEALAEIAEHLAALRTQIEDMGKEIRTLHAARHNAEEQARLALDLLSKIWWLSMRTAITAGGRKVFDWALGVAAGALLYKFAPHLVEAVKGLSP